MERHAYLVMAHSQPEVLETLLHMLDVEWNDIFLHIDRRNPALQKHVEQLASCSRPLALSPTFLHRARLFVLPSPLSVYWGHTSQIEAELMLLRIALSHGPHVYYHLLSGCDLPIKSAREIYDFFAQHRGREFLGFWNGERDRRDAFRKVRYYYLLNRYKKRSAGWRHLLTTPLRNLLLAAQKAVSVNRLRHADREVKKGFNWFSITEGCGRYVLAHEADIRRMFHHTLCGDEIFLHTLLWDSPFRPLLYDVEDPQRGSMRAIDWQRGRPYVWQAEDVPRLIGSPYLFARKFSSMDAVEEVIKRVEANT